MRRCKRKPFANSTVSGNTIRNPSSR
ncbi:hypothetical protein [Pseudoramibacter alactolyticus]|nr:hypothetical protein [Pseudoramibacter alactolyticus]